MAFFTRYEALDSTLYQSSRNTLDIDGITKPGTLLLDRFEVNECFKVVYFDLFIFRLLTRPT